MRIDRFTGERREAPPSKIPPSAFQTDQGGDRFHRKSWRRRRGMRHTDIAKQSSSVTSLLGFALPEGGYATLLVAGAEVHGFDGVEQE